MTRPIVELTKEIQSALVERDEPVLGTSAALLSKQHVVLLGPPGTAKSKQLLMLVRHLKGARIFERLLFETTPTEEVLGPLSLKALKNDEYRRVTTGRIQTADIAYLEEVFNANDPILHALMRLINERLYEEGDRVVPVPLQSVVAATNVIPTKPGLMAVYDRFLLRFRVPDIQDNDSFLRMLKMPDPESLVKQDLTLDELHEAQKETAALEVTDDVYTGLVQIRAALRSNGIEPSPRRFKQAVGVLKAYAYLGGRDVVGMDDLSATRYMLWTTPEQEAKVAQEVLRVASPML
ncbi:MAG: AAA family ATPase, partial [Euryarchaeota archaeon]|nr:AAA family ATPase [Euryarchaeota archaeon]